MVYKLTELNSYKKVRNVLAGILVLNLLVALAKVIFGKITNTYSMVADGFHSFSDGSSNIVGIIGVWIAAKPADESHPYGHHKFETLSTIVISLLLFFVSYNLLSDAYARLKNPSMPEINIYSFIVMLITLGVNLWVTNYESKKGKELKSSILISDAKHTKSDIYVSISVIVSLIAIKLGFIIVDTIVAGIISILIIKAGLEILLPGINILSDASVINSDEIYDLVIKVPEVQYCHKIRSRGKENHVMIDLHVGLDKNFTLDHSHKIAHEIGDMLKHKIEGVQDVIVHIEPADVFDKVD